MRISVIFTGGTIGSTRHEGGIGTDAAAPRELLLRYREASGDKTVFDTAEPYTILSENLTLAHIAQLAACIKEKTKDSDGIIVTHGTDTLPYTAAALAYIRGLAAKPVVLVSSNYVLGDMRANGVDNFRAAVDFLRQCPTASGVFVSYRNTGEPGRILRASRLFAHLAPTDTVYTLNGTVATWRDGQITLNKDFVECEDSLPPLAAADPERFAERVLFLRAHPGMVYPPLTKEIAAVLLETYHSGTLATATAPLAAFTASAKAMGIPVFAAGITGETVYESANLYANLGITPLPPMSPLAAYLKLVLTLSCGLDPKATLPLPLGGDMS